MNTNEMTACYEVKHSEDAQKLVTKHPDIVGIGFGPKEKKGQLTEEVSIKLYVRKKVEDKGELGNRCLPKKLKNISTDVIEIAPLRARASFKQRVRPVLGGVSGAVHVPNLTYTGTLGMAVRGYGSYSGRFFVLSNNHVIANVNDAQIGDPVIQPGTLDGGDPTNDAIGALFDYVPLQFGNPNAPIGNQPKNSVDAALAEVNFGEISREIFWLGYPKGWLKKASLQSAVVNAGGRLRVQKTGRTTAYTTGNITDLGYDGWVNYDQGRFAYFEDQILISPGNFSSPGDSGSIIFNMDEQIVGLLFAGGATHTIANHIEDVWNQLPALEFSDLPR